ncbi:hypothetical protein ACFLWW_00335, partial [Chloroflexota bacterium]
KMAISGRITQRGTVASIERISPRRLLLEHGQIKILDSSAKDMDEVVFQMGKNDVFIIGANAIDINRKAAIMVGDPFGGSASRVPGLAAQGVTIIIAVGWEKLIPCPIEEAVFAAGTDKVDVSMGMAVGLIPISGTVVTETDAISMLADVKTTMIGAGGVMGGEGSSTFVIEGEQSKVKLAWEIVSSIKGTELSAVPESLTECVGKSSRCAQYVTVSSRHVPLDHRCVYREPHLVQKMLSTK